VNCSQPSTTKHISVAHPCLLAGQVLSTAREHDRRVVKERRAPGKCRPDVTSHDVLSKMSDTSCWLLPVTAGQSRQIVSWSHVS
jgi:hypothetical protein